ncbi:hypothetical protein PR003_g17343 [Phytophthora rubi]|uniref:Intimal thickness related receptor IRP domain-containing protein n=1 Tax=Phytophthora rubi TaxID=129364 RepID=A0A6A3K6H9_9STRA|nr:hypothetical protein PR001_g18530 [Phytophthora rubi]KAE9003106.1 hypothetical protein PR002_g17438 [Phytophthora rubi]KAE9321979.1 hypothetical protein PR003_g17343 [Phytophthora rubi]
MAITQDDMDAISRSIFIPVMLVLDVWSFQYLVSVYYSKSKEFRVRSLLLAAFLGFVTQVYSHDDREMALKLNDISETSLQLTFVTQIVLIGRAVCKKVKLRSILYFTYVAETLVVLGWLNMIGTILEIADVIHGDTLSLTGNVLESTSLVFVMVFRFYYLSLTHGFKVVLQERKFELLLYVLLVIHEFPFMIIEHYTGVTWEFAQGIGNRVLVVACIVQNVRQKAISSRSSNKSSAVRSKRYAPSSMPKQLSSAGPTLKSTFVKPGAFPAPHDMAKIAVTSIKEQINAT